MRRLGAQVAPMALPTPEADREPASWVEHGVVPALRPHVGVAPCPDCGGPALVRVERDQVIGACTCCWWAEVMGT